MRKPYLDKGVGLIAGAFLAVFTAAVLLGGMALGTASVALSAEVECVHGSLDYLETSFADSGGDATIVTGFDKDALHDFALAAGVRPPVAGSIAAETEGIAIASTPGYPPDIVSIFLADADGCVIGVFPEVPRSLVSAALGRLPSVPPPVSS